MRGEAQLGAAWHVCFPAHLSSDPEGSDGPDITHSSSVGIQRRSPWPAAGDLGVFHGEQPLKLASHMSPWQPGQHRPKHCQRLYPSEVTPCPDPFADKIPPFLPYLPSISSALGRSFKTRVYYVLTISAPLLEPEGDVKRTFDLAVVLRRAQWQSCAQSTGHLRQETPHAGQTIGSLCVSVRLWHLSQCSFPAWWGGSKYTFDLCRWNATS